MLETKDAAMTINQNPPDHLAVRRHMPKPLQQCDLQLRIELRVPGDSDTGMVNWLYLLDRQAVGGYDIYDIYKNI